MFDFVFITHTIKDMTEGVFLPGLIGELDAIVSEDRVDPVAGGPRARHSGMNRGPRIVRSSDRRLFRS